MSAIKQLTGMRFGRLIVSDREGTSRDGKALWRCTCDCGGEALVTTRSLTAGRTRSCGCLWREVMREANTTHGHATGGVCTRVYNTWVSMLQRCFNTNREQYKRYGGRGITVCDRWKQFENFLADMGEPGPGMELDRIDNDQGYKPGNCRWTTKKQQANNKRNTVKVEYEGATIPLSMLCQSDDPQYEQIRKRIRDYGWTTEQALKTPVRLGNRVKQP